MYSQIGSRKLACTNVKSCARNRCVEGQRQRVQLTQPRHTLIRFRSVTDHVAQTPHAVIRRRGAQHRFQRDQIGVNIREEQNSHRKRIVAQEKISLVFAFLGFAAVCGIIKKMLSSETTRASTTHLELLSGRKVPEVTLRQILAGRCIRYTAGFVSFPDWQACSLPFSE